MHARPCHTEKRANRISIAALKHCLILSELQGNVCNLLKLFQLECTFARIRRDKHIYSMSTGTYHNLETLQLTTEGDKEFEEILIATFCEEAPKLVTGMKEAHASGDMKEMGRFAHSIKPNAQMFGIDSIRDIVLEVEECGKENNNDPVLKEHIETIEKVIFQVVKELQ